MKGKTMKKFVFSLVLSAILLVFSAACSESAHFICGSDLAEFSGKVFSDLTVSFDGCAPEDLPVRLENVTVTGEVRLISDVGDNRIRPVQFAGSRLNRFYVSGGFEIVLEKESSIAELILAPAPNGSGNISIKGMAENAAMPAYYRTGYLCEGQPEFEAYAGLDSETSVRLMDIEMFSGMAYVGKTVIHAAEHAAVSLENVWLHRVEIIPDEVPTDDFTVCTKGMTYVDLLDSGVSFSLHNLNAAHFRGILPACSPIASDYMRIGLMVLHSDGDLSVAMDNQYVDRLVFFGSGCRNSTLYLDDYNDSGKLSRIDRVSVYDGNAEFTAKTIPYAEFLIAPEIFSSERFGEYFGFVRNALMDRCGGLGAEADSLALCRNLSQFPEAGSAYWDRLESVKVWDRLSNYYHIPSVEKSNGRFAYLSNESDIPYFFVRAAYLDTVKFSTAYGTPDTEIPSYIREKSWLSANPAYGPGGLAGIAWNGGCSFNRNMTVGGITYCRCLENLKTK